ncbi:glycosyltransferase family 2 protein [Longirhabdus pacifica]|uniref:glycosyltransferase family 2 protein n=1 Tax=Longirhabdus pacifica TaxID=2305227 RepID=UPI0010090AAE|nr:glycosyltransferase family 2 protein [Longirhabdus pacifica]
MTNHHETDKITIAILAKDKEHLLPYYLQCIENQTYPASKIKLYIRTNNNVDQTANVLKKWINKVAHRYDEIFYDDSDVNAKVEQYKPHEWNALRFQVLGKIRQDSIAWANQKHTHYFTVDCDNFIIPNTLQRMYDTLLPVVGPFMKHDDATSSYSNYHFATCANGYFVDHPFYYKIQQQEIKGLIQVDVVHCAYFIRHNILQHITYLDNTERHEYVIFSDRLRKRKIKQYIDNRVVYGLITFCTQKEKCNVHVLHTLQSMIGHSLSKD